MKTNDMILKYLSGLLQELEKKEFELQLMQSDQLQKEVNEQLKVLKQLRDLSVLPKESSYFNNLLPKVRQSLGVKKKFRLYPKLAYVLPVAAVIAFFVLNPFGHKEISNSDIPSILAEIHEDTKTDILEDIFDNETTGSVHSAVASDSSNSEILDKTIVNELFKNDDLKASYIETDDLVSSLSREEVQTVYNSLLNKKIL